MPKQDKNPKNNDHVTKNEFKGRLDKVDVRFDKVDERFQKIDGRFDKVELALQNQAAAIISNTEDIKIIKETMATKDDVQKILSAVDNIARDVIDVGRKSVVNTHRINEMDIKIEEHEKRISRLESAHHK
ncbi:MAG: hypothetical protein LHV68_02420 [Elusimicrobia bacterium]|nr:hypothetical protein [Candidatus Liberimonas magnetica]